MPFSSLIFVGLFLPLSLLALWLAARFSGENHEPANCALLLFSLIFTLFAGLGGLLILLGTTLLGWLGGRGIEKSPQPRKALCLTLALLIGILAFFKYAGLALSLPVTLGISFYIFKIISYEADIYRKKIPAERNFLHFLLYVICFHHISQGPILRYDSFKQDLLSRRITPDAVAAGIMRFSLGLAKKVILADQMGTLTNTVFPLSENGSGIPTLGIWLGSLLFSLQMYLDFSAYTDMALGLGKIAGFTYPENFDYPYCAPSVKQFWRRWHMSLSFFFRDYVYIPLGGNRKGKARTSLNLLIVWLLTGIWHGPTWNFLLWGLYYFLFISLENLTERLPFRLPGLLRHIYVIFVFNLGWLLFRITDLKLLGKALRGFFGFTSPAGFSSPLITTLLGNNIFILMAAVLACTPLWKGLGQKAEAWAASREGAQGLLAAGRILLCAAALILSVIIMAGSSYQPFLYNNF